MRLPVNTLSRESYAEEIDVYRRAGDERLPPDRR